MGQKAKGYVAAALMWPAKPSSAKQFVCVRSRNNRQLLSAGQWASVLVVGSFIAYMWWQSSVLRSLEG